MSKDVKIRIEIDSKSGEARISAVGKEFDKAAGKVDTFGQMFKRADAVFGRVTSRLGMVAGAAASAAAGFAAWKGMDFFRDVMDTAAGFEQLEIRLNTIQGSSEQAKESLAWVQDFTARTPFELDQVADAFTKLSAYGLDAMNLLPTLGDTAAGMGKDLNQTVEMMADAVTGQFERLKEFGVKASTQGDQVTFRWSQNGRDMEVTTQKTAESITGALEGIFDRFEGGMAEQAKSWNGMLSNLSDQFTMFKAGIAESGLFDFMKSKMDELLSWIGSMKESGKLDEWQQYISDKMVAVGQKVSELAPIWGRMAKGATDFASAGLNALDMFTGGLGLASTNWKASIDLAYNFWLDKIEEVHNKLTEENRFYNEVYLKTWMDLQDQAEAGFKMYYNAISGWMSKEFDLMKSNLKTAYDYWAEMAANTWDRLEINFFFKFEKQIDILSNTWDQFTDRFGDALIENVERMKTALTSLWERIKKLSGASITVEGKTKFSPVRGFSEGMDYAEQRIRSFSDLVEGTNPAMTVAGNIDLSQHIEKAANKLAAAHGLAESSRSSYGPYSWLQRKVAKQEVAMATGQYQYLMDLAEQLAETAAPAGGAGSVSRSGSMMMRPVSGGMASFGDVHVNVPPNAAPQRPNDWRSIVQNHIIPELQAAGFGKA